MLKDERLVQHQSMQHPTSEELRIWKIKFKAFDFGGHQIARLVWKDCYAKSGGSHIRSVCASNVVSLEIIVSTHNTQIKHFNPNCKVCPPTLHILNKFSSLRIALLLFVRYLLVHFLDNFFVLIELIFLRCLIVVIKLLF
ncbi:hypothetical protein RND81_05G043400 [Saponaria officinalis]|uniref:Uncharacterized protein n=1 Tax=Saponaria officinalis TaxID=3572 RepID=A0AAW1KQN4_SAPOF